MEANKAPEKIYIQSFNVREEDAKFDRSKERRVRYERNLFIIC